MAAATRTRPVLSAGRAVGAVALAAMAAIHLYLWFDGYADVPMVGPAFLVDFVAGVLAVLALLAARGRAVALVALAGAVLMAGTLAALLLSLTVGLFGFFDAISAPLVPTTLVVESVGVVVLAVTAVLGRAGRRGPRE